MEKGFPSACTEHVLVKLDAGRAPLYMLYIDTWTEYRHTNLQYDSKWEVQGHN